MLSLARAMSWGHLFNLHFKSMHTQNVLYLHKPICCHLHIGCLQCECCWGRMWSLVVSAWFNIGNIQRKPYNARLEFSQAYEWRVKSFNEKQLINHCIWPDLTNQSSDSNWWPSSYKSCSVTFRVQLTFESLRSRVTSLVEFPKEVSSETAAIKTGRFFVDEAPQPVEEKHEVVSGCLGSKLYSMYLYFHHTLKCH